VSTAAVEGGLRPFAANEIRPEWRESGLLQAERTAQPDRAWPSGFVRTLAASLFVLWSLGLLLVLARLIVGIWCARRLTREGEALEDSVWERLLRRFISAVSLKRKVDLKTHRLVIVPLTWGFLRPVVLMPDGARTWTEDERSSALFHELSHVKRGDFLVMVLVRLSLALFWFNPLCWLVYKRVKIEQEKACDELVIRAGVRPSTYAHNLLSFKRSVCLTRSPSAAFLGVLGMFGRSHLNERLVAILRQKIAFKEVQMKTKVIVSVLAFLAVSFIGLARPSRATAIKETEPVVLDTMVAGPVLAVQETAAPEPQKATEKQKKEPAKSAEPKEKEDQVKKEVKIVVEGEKGQGEPVEITIIDGKTQKVIKLDKPILIEKKGEGGKKIILSSEGKEIAVIEGDGTRLKIKGGRMTFLNEAKTLKLDKEPMVFTIVEGDKKESHLIVGKEPHIEIVKEVREPEHLEIGKEAEEPEKVTVKVVRQEGEEKAGVTKSYVIAKPFVTVHIDEEGLKKKIAETQALLEKIEVQKLVESSLEAQKEALRELQQSLKGLQEELNKEAESLKALKVHVEPRVLVEPKVHVQLDHLEIPEVKVEEFTPGEEGKDRIITIKGAKEACTVVMTMQLKNNPKETYEKTIAKLKQELPQGFELEPKFIEESGTMVLKITGQKCTEESWEQVKELVKELRAELKK
jgi:beta-lactamase regulating signal transducer with metallopeptidase domain